MTIPFAPDVESATLASDATAVEWLERADRLLAEPSPGPTPFAVEELLVDGACGFVQGTRKVGKTWVLLELAISLVTGRPAFGRFAVPEPGPVIFVMEESGRAAFHRRLDALARGKALDRKELAGLHFAANLRVRLTDAEWQARLLAAGSHIKPRAIFLDPWVRLASGVDENAVKEIGPLLDFCRDLREVSGAAVLLSHHTPHDSERLRGSGDFEAWWESKLVVSRNDGQRSVRAEHREAEDTAMVDFSLAYDEATRTMRLTPSEASEIERDVERYLNQYPDASKNAVFKALGGHRKSVLVAVDRVRSQGGRKPVPADGYHPGTGDPAPAAESGTPDPPPSVGGGGQVPPRRGVVPNGDAPAEPDVEDLIDRAEGLA